MRPLLAVLTLAFLLSAAPASAQTPAGCAGSGLQTALAWTPAKGRADLESTLTVTVTQSGATACDVSGVTLRVALPGPDGQPSATTRLLADNVRYPSGMAPVTFTVPWTVSLNPGVTSATASLSLSGTLEDVLRTPLTMAKTLRGTIIAPKLGLAVTADPPAAAAPFDVTYRFTLTNQEPGGDPLTQVTLAHPASSCTPGNRSGDTNGDDALDATETWLYTCTRRFTAPGDHTTTSAAVAIASDGREVRAADVTTTVGVQPGPALGNLTLSTVADPASGFAPLTVIHTYAVRNGGTGPVRDVVVTDSGCSPVTTTAGNAPLGAGETRIFTCSRRFATVGTFTTGAIAEGVDVTSGRGVSSTEVKTDVATAATPAATTSPDPDPDPAPTATPTPRPATKPSTRVSFTAAGRFARPCRGRIALTLKAGNKTLARRSARASRTCRYRVKLTVARSRLGKATRVTVTARLGKATKTQRLAVPR